MCPPTRVNSRYTISRLKQNDVARDQRGNRRRDALARAQNPGAGCEQRSQRAQGLFRLAFLDEANDGIYCDDTNDHRGVDPVPQCPGQRRGAEEKEDQRVVELHQESQHGGCALLGCQLIRPVNGQAMPSVLWREAFTLGAQLL